MNSNYLIYTPDMTIDQKCEVIKANTKVADSLSKQMISSNTNLPFVQVGEIPKRISQKPLPMVVPFDEKFIELYQIVISSSPEQVAEKISTVINSHDSNYFKYINMLKIKIYEDMIGASNLAFESYDLEESEAQSIYAELNSLLAAINELEEEEELIASSQNTKNTLFFMTSLNRVVVYEAIDKDIPTDMYEQVLDLIKGIEVGEFKGLKYLHAKKMFEVRLGEVRITFAKLSNNKFVILGCFLKKFDSNQSYRDMMYRVRDQFLSEKSYYLSQSENPEFLAEHQKYLDDIIALCKTKGRVRE